jgi:hypothetical protein
LRPSAQAVPHVHLALNTVVASCASGTFLIKYTKVKKANGGINSLNVINKKRPTKVKKFDI